MGAKVQKKTQTARFMNHTVQTNIINHPYILTYGAFIDVFNNLITH